VERVYGPDLLLACCAVSVEKGWQHFFYGGAPGVAERLATLLRDRFSGIRIVGVESPPYRDLTTNEDEALMRRIGAADLLWVGLGTPKQERWMHAHLGTVSAKVMIGVGAAFDFLSGTKRQAPRWMRQSGLEWVFRLLSEPGRLWRRYLVNNPLFVWKIALQAIRVRHYDIGPKRP
jgi:N-acetylglucosaminyldiphosphoundecaprenol N-acetyl-beta-D-mannosaminyltransferase